MEGKLLSTDLTNDGAERLQGYADMSQEFPVRFSVAGDLYERNVEPRTLLSGLLGDDLCLTGTHVGCRSSTLPCVNRSGSTLSRIPP